MTKPKPKPEDEESFDLWTIWMVAVAAAWLALMLYALVYRPSRPPFDECPVCRLRDRELKQHGHTHIPRIEEGKP